MNSPSARTQTETLMSPMCKTVLEAIKRWSLALSRSLAFWHNMYPCSYASEVVAAAVNEYN